MTLKAHCLGLVASLLTRFLQNAWCPEVRSYRTMNHWFPPSRQNSLRKPKRKHVFLCPAAHPKVIISRANKEGKQPPWETQVLEEHSSPARKLSNRKNSTIAGRAFTLTWKEEQIVRSGVPQHTWMHTSGPQGGFERCPQKSTQNNHFCTLETELQTIAIEDSGYFVQQNVSSWRICSGPRQAALGRAEVHSGLCSWLADNTSFR